MEVFFRIRKEKDYLDDSIYTMRVHCKHIGMRDVEKLKDELLAIRLPVKHRNKVFAESLYGNCSASTICP